VYAGAVSSSRGCTCYIRGSGGRKYPGLWWVVEEMNPVQMLETSSTDSGSVQKILSCRLTSGLAIPPLSRYENKVIDHNFGSLIRMNSKEEHSESNTIFGAFCNPVSGSVTKPLGSDARAILVFEVTQTYSDVTTMTGTVRRRSRRECPERSPDHGFDL